MNQPRFHSLDAIRAVAMLLGVVLHAAMSMTEPNIPFWPAEDSQKTIFLTLMVFVIHSFRLQVFFIMAGFFAAMLKQRRGYVGYCVHRTKRVVFPLFVFTLILIPIIQLLFVIGLADRGEIPEFGKTGIKIVTRDLAKTVPEALTIEHFYNNFHFFHLWFLWYLIWMYVASIPVSWLFNKLHLTASINKIFRRILGTWAKPLILSIPVILLLYPMRTWSPDAPDKVWIQIELFACYGFYFLIGWLLYQHKENIAEFGKYWKAKLILAPLLLIPIIYCFMHSPIDAESYDPRFHLPAIAVYAIFSWLMIFGFSGLFMELFSNPDSKMRYISDSAYWIYLVHMPVVIVLQLVVEDWPINVFVKFALLVAVATAILYLTYHFLVRGTFIGLMLNGRKM